MMSITVVVETVISLALLLQIIGNQSQKGLFGRFLLFFLDVQCVLVKLS